MGPPRSRPAKIPRVVATGFTTAFLGDERTLREFVVGDHVARSIRDRGGQSVLYLINDSYDALTFRQLRVGLEKDEVLLEKFEPYCGRPIAEVPDPHGCHESYSEHFTSMLVRRLESLGIHPVVLDTYRAYRGGLYEAYLQTTFERYGEIEQELADGFSEYAMRNLFRPQCPKCQRLDATEIGEATADRIRFSCEECGIETTQDREEVRGKLSWKLDCAARWNLYDVDVEVFSKAHFGEQGTLEISKFVSERYFGGRIPRAVSYGDVRISPDLSRRLLEILPPPVFKKLLTTRLNRDVFLTREHIETFCNRAQIRPGLSYGDYVRKILPHEALGAARHWKAGGGPARNGDGPDEASLVEYGNRFSRFFYDRDFSVRLPEPQVFENVDRVTAVAAGDVLRHTLSVRNGDDCAPREMQERIKAYLFTHKVPPRVYSFLRSAFRQPEGPNITTLLAILPRDFLEIINVILSFRVKEAQAGLPGSSDDSRAAPAPSAHSYPGGES